MVTSVIAVIAGIAGAISGIGAFLNTRRDLETKADTSYVDRNLAVMQAANDFQEADRQRLRREKEELERKVDELHAQLDDCNRRCDECLSRIRNLERNA